MSELFELFDFGDGRGPVPAHRHPNGGGWVAETAYVDEAAYVGWEARVYGSARVYDGAWVRESAVVCERAWLSDYVEVKGNSIVRGDVELHDRAMVYGNAEISGSSYLFGVAHVAGSAKVCGYAGLGASADVNSPWDLKWGISGGEVWTLYTTTQKSLRAEGSFGGDEYSFSWALPPRVPISDLFWEEHIEAGWEMAKR